MAHTVAGRRSVRTKEIQTMADKRSVFMAALSVSLAAAVSFGNAPDKTKADTPISLGASHNWTLTVEVNIQAYQGWKSDGRPDIEFFEFDSAAVIFPLNLETGSSKLKERQVVSQLTFDDRLETRSYETLTGYHSGTRFGKWAIKSKKGREAQLKVELPIVCYETVYNEQAAAAMDWPKGDWPEDAQSTFARQMFIDYGAGGNYDMRHVEKLVKNWTKGKDPKSIKPAVLAKWLAGRVQEYFQPANGNGMMAARNGLLEGINVLGAARAARTGRGSKFDMACLLTAVYREAGLPARLVVGWDTKKDEDKLFGKKGSGELRSWVEFCLYDEDLKQTTWVPVDLVTMRQKRGNRALDMDKTWPYFGTHDELDDVIPFSFHFHPETTVQAFGSPGFWGWFVLPEPPKRAYQYLRFMATTTPQGGHREPVEQDDGGEPSERRRKRGR